MQQCITDYGTKICDIYGLQKCLMQTWVDFKQNIIDSLRSCMRAGDGHFEHVLQKYCLFVLCGSSEHFMKLSM